MWTSEVQYESAERKQTTGYSVLKRNGEYVGRVFTVLAQIIVDALNAKPYVLVTISGGVGDVFQNASNVDVDVLDFDNLEATEPADGVLLSDHEWEYLKTADPDEYARLRPGKR